MRDLAVNEQTRATVTHSPAAKLRLSNTWWQWPNLSALDAPLVAVVWLHAFSRSAGETVQWPVSTGLFLAVWCIYLADRLIDARRLNDLATASDRHRFARRNWRSLLALLAVAAIAGGFLAVTRIDADLLRTASALALVVGIYFGIFVRKSGACGRRILPAKEFACGVVFAIGCVLGVSSFRETPLAFLPMMMLFGGVCVFNCLLISAWEKSSDQNNDPAAASRWWKSLERDLTWIGVVLTVFCTVGIFTAHVGSIFLAMSGSSALLTLLHLGRNCRWSSVAIRRVLADAVLLTPLVIQAVG